MKQRSIRNLAFPCLPFAVALGVLTLTAGSAFAAPAGQAKNIGPEDESKQVSVTVWLNPHNKAALDNAVEQMYDKSSPNYHRFLTLKEFNEQYAPTEKEAGVVRDYLSAHGMKVMSTQKNNRFVVAQGKVGDAQTAFNTKINKVMMNGEVHRAAATEASVTGEAAPLVASVQGLSNLRYRAYAQRASNPETKIPYAGVSPSAVGADGLFFSAECLRPPQSKVFKTDGGFPEAFYAGNRYGADITNTNPPNLPPCGYDAAEMQTAYGLKPLYKRGLDGTGQTIVIVDAFGSNSILSDANLFSELNGLPALTSSNFQIVKPTGPVTCTDTNGCISGNWQFETTLDVEWAHAMAPGANIVLVVAADDSSSLDLSNLDAIENGYGNVISNSFGIPEIVLQQLDPAQLVVENGISEIAAALGISHNISSGDDGDNLALDQTDFGIDSVSVGANADSPFATGIGGTSTFLDSKSNIELQTGWGLNFARIADPTPNPPVIPPLLFGFNGGSGGGTSVVYKKPKYQKSLKGKFRQVPDISMNADPQTGNEVVVSPDGIPAHAEVDVFGGTSLSCPMFSAIWAIANQAAGGGPIGQAAPILYELPESAIIDVNLTPVDTLLNVSGLIIDPPKAPLFETPADLAQPLENTRRFVSALYQSPSSTRWDVFTFGTDSSLVTGPGWDNVTGLGTPNGATFINKVVKAVQ
ncbi:S53 family peptidase [Tunturiibacter lichenicola]|uniref:S53 family peptidase n=1 Tax=Tunturiibacter lichenicola TaxID=2051959 RepID=UPI003D9BBEC4